MDETGNFFLMKLIVGFAISTAQTFFIVVDSHLRKKYQAQPRRQEWVTAVECVCVDGKSISPFVIFKGKNLTNSWIPLELQNPTKSLRTILKPRTRHRPKQISISTTNDNCG